MSLNYASFDRIIVNNLTSRDSIIDPSKGLYFAGETVDIDTDTGGYNLQAAFSTGIIVGEVDIITNQSKAHLYKLLNE